MFDLYIKIVVSIDKTFSWCCSWILGFAALTEGLKLSLLLRLLLGCSLKTSKQLAKVEAFQFQHIPTDYH